MVGLRLEIGGTMHLEKYDPSEWNNKHLHWTLNQFYKSCAPFNMYSNSIRLVMTQQYGLT